MRFYSVLFISGLVASAAAAPVEHKSTHGAVASEVKECSEAGGDVLEKGGNAVDAMIATVLCVGTIGMHHSGIGGGGFALVRARDGSHNFIDFRETAPAAAFETMFVNRTGSPSLYSGQAAGVPGELRGLEALHGKFGTLPWKSLFQPAIHYARNGFTVNEDLAKVIVGLDYLKDDPAWAKDFAPNGTLVQKGQKMFRKRYADTLEKISKKGANAFYEGEIAEKLVETLKAKTGIITLEDLKGYKVAEREPLSIEYRGHKITAGSAPSSGTVVLSALKIFGNFEITGDKGVDYHRLIEATKFGYGQRTNFGDPSFLSNLTDYQHAIIEPSFTTALAGKILTDSILPNISLYNNPTGLESIETPGTSHIVTTDASGLSVSLTTTINTWFGSRIMDPTTGVIFNNQMDDFSVPGSSNFFGYLPSEANFIRPGKRPLSSISTVIVEPLDSDAKQHPLTSTSTLPKLIIGAAGGSRIITATIQNIHHVLSEGLNVTEALAEARWHDQLSPETTSLETRVPEELADELRRRGHNVTRIAEGQSSAQGIQVWVEEKGSKCKPKGKKKRVVRFEAAGEPRQMASGGVVV